MRLGIAVAVLLSLAACSGGESKTEESSQSVAAKPSPSTSPGAGYFEWLKARDLEPIEGVPRSDIAATAVAVCKWALDGGDMARIGQPGVLDVPEYLTEREIGRIGYAAIRGECPEVNQEIIDEYYAENPPD